MATTISVWLPVAMVLGWATTGPVPTAKSTSAGTDCHLGTFYLSPHEMEAFKKARDALEKDLLLRDCGCSSPLFPGAWGLRKLRVWERPVALQAELALTLEVLGSVTDPALEDVLERPLRTLAHIHAQLRACVSARVPVHLLGSEPRPSLCARPSSQRPLCPPVPAGPTAAPRPRSHLLSHWLRRLNQATKKESPVCLQASVTFNLFRLLIRDLRCVARPELCA